VKFGVSAMIEGGPPGANPPQVERNRIRAHVIAGPVAETI